MIHMWYGNGITHTGMRLVTWHKHPLTFKSFYSSSLGEQVLIVGHHLCITNVCETIQNWLAFLRFQTSAILLLCTTSYLPHSLSSFNLPTLHLLPVNIAPYQALQSHWPASGGSLRPSDTGWWWWQTSWHQNSPEGGAAVKLKEKEHLQKL